MCHELHSLWHVCYCFRSFVRDFSDRNSSLTPLVLYSPTAARIPLPAKMHARSADPTQPPRRRACDRGRTRPSPTTFSTNQGTPTLLSGPRTDMNVGTAQRLAGAPASRRSEMPCHARPLRIPPLSPSLPLVSAHPCTRALSRLHVMYVAARTFLLEGAACARKHGDGMRAWRSGQGRMSKLSRQMRQL